MSNIFESEILRERIEDLQSINVNYFIGVDTYDKTTSAYCLARKIGEKVEILLVKSKTDKIEFQTEVENLAKYFNAKIIKEA